MCSVRGMSALVASCKGKADLNVWGCNKWRQSAWVCQSFSLFKVADNGAMFHRLYAPLTVQKHFIGYLLSNLGV